MLPLYLFDVTQFWKDFLFICFQNLTGHEKENRNDIFIALVFQTWRSWQDRYWNCSFLKKQRSLKHVEITQKQQILK